MDNGLKIPNEIFPAPDRPVGQDAVEMKQNVVMTPEIKTTPVVDMGKIGEKTMKATLGNNAMEIVENGMTELRKDPSDGYEAIQEAREKFARGEI